MATMTINSNELTGAAWAGDFLNREHLLPGGGKVDADQWEDGTAYTVTVDDMSVAQNDTTLGVAALGVAIPAGTVLDFGQHTAGYKQMAKLSAAAAAAATSLAVEPLAAEIENAAEATYYANPNGMKPIPSGTLVGRTYAERNSGVAFGPAASDGSDDEVYLVAFDVTDALQNNDVELYRPGSVVKENLLPGWSTMADPLKAQLRAIYSTVKGQA